MKGKYEYAIGNYKIAIQQQQSGIGVNDYGSEEAGSSNALCIRLLDKLMNVEGIKRKRADFINRLPTELAYCIFAGLPKDSKSVCLRVCHRWRTKLLECVTAWSCLNMDGSAGDKEITSLLPHITSYIHDLSFFFKR
ncbi:hypothetical protein BDA99DRAFT_510126 [Phascolomyces articulosus]|uniref:F-box domain-containing protein n=1 Tax=Phascolomyces articulosus TaxID=60185 RepID=A0AAD5KAA3_9FUNG|nr:hypothetical protein BDA99DRAFT_510126 [Phascolomyces articulosus]